jgi:hypothetical protein
MIGTKMNPKNTKTNCRKSSVISIDTFCRGDIESE